MTALVVIAKQCVPGKVKTRLCPPFSLDHAAQLASACLSDTLVAASGVNADRKILYFDGEIVPPEAADFEIVSQPSGSLDERLAFIFDALSEPVFLIGMDTPQITPDIIGAACAKWPKNVDAWFGPASDGGFWALGLGRLPHRGALVRGVPMSDPCTGQRQLERLVRAKLRVKFLPELMDVDTVDSLMDVARLIPASALSRTLATVQQARKKS